MDVIAVVLMLAGVGQVWSHRQTEETPKPLTPWNEPVNHAKPIQSRPNSDASMATMALRRRVIAGVHRTGQPFGYKGQDNGVVEAQFLSGICPPLPAAALDILYEGGCADDEFCDVLNDNGSGVVRDGGNAKTTACDTAAPPIPQSILYEGGCADDEFCEVLNDNGLGIPRDGGGATTTTCDTAAPPIPQSVLYEGGCADDEFCEVLNDNGLGIPRDGGGATTTTCDTASPPVPRPVLQEGGAASDEICEVLNDDGTGIPRDAGNAATNVCDN